MWVALNDTLLGRVRLALAGTPEVLEEFDDAVWPAGTSIDDDAAFVAVAAREYTDEDVVIDQDAVVSRADEGAYVMAWVWVTNDEAGIQESDEEED